MAKEIGSETEVPFRAEIVAILKVYALTVLTVGGLLLLSIDRPFSAMLMHGCVDTFVVQYPES